MKLILLTPPTFFVEEHIIINALFEEGLDILHIRKPDSEPIFCERLLKLIDSRWHKRIVVHDHFYLKPEFGLKGIHLNQRNPQPPKNYRGQLSRTCHTFDEVQQWKAKCDYVFLSPIFDSVSRSGHQSPFTPKSLEEAAERGIIDRKVVAVGGVTPNNLGLIRNLGFGGAAVLGDIWTRFDFHSSSSYKELINHFKILRSLSE
ncbi:MAG: thiamine phosphate synthase [Prevotellaceae bacterium]|nr:thiamine phosphate synthase [Prevotellaceae bacterium]